MQQIEILFSNYELGSDLTEIQNLMDAAGFANTDEWSEEFVAGNINAYEYYDETNDWYYYFYFEAGSNQLVSKGIEYYRELDNPNYQALIEPITSKYLTLNTVGFTLDNATIDNGDDYSMYEFSNADYEGEIEVWEFDTDLNWTGFWVRLNKAGWWRAE